MGNSRKKAILIKDGKVVIVENKTNTYNYEKIVELLDLGGSPFTIVRRKIGEHYYDIYLDDEGLLKGEEFECYAYDSKSYLEALVGTLLITQTDGKGNTIGLTDKEIEEVQSKIEINDSSYYRFYSTSVGMIKLLFKQDKCILHYEI